MENLKKPSWLKKRIPPLHDLQKVKKILDKGGLHTVCEEARCPNLGECFAGGTATFLILGEVCTRNCAFCAVQHGNPAPPAENEPERIARAVVEMGLHYVVITSVTRDDLPDGGASLFANTIGAIRGQDQRIKIEALVPDFRGDISSLETILHASPDVLNHNIETIQRLYSEVRPQANYGRSLGLLKKSKELYPQLHTKSGFMLGLGETHQEVMDLMEDLRETGCDLLTIGQYLQPRSDRLPVVRFIPPEEFEEYKKLGERIGFKAVASGPFVRSSFHASQMFEGASN
ncbi:MAG: lipoyl synthase [Deltaproteobacteria bacterium RBG_16_49_23]|nr:MAG: lipoyl synthase [Deltaproteobacteria bacterium RBG_16_49_23]